MAGNGSNQFTKADELGKERPEGQNAYTAGTGAKARDRNDPLTKARLRASLAAAKLEAHINGECEIDAVTVSACKALMDKGMPSLASVENTTVNEFETMSQDELESMVRALITADPTLLQRLNLAPKPVVVGQDDTKAA